MTVAELIEKLKRLPPDARVTREVLDYDQTLVTRKYNVTELDIENIILVNDNKVVIDFYSKED